MHLEALQELVVGISGERSVDEVLQSIVQRTAVSRFRVQPMAHPEWIQQETIESFAGHPVVFRGDTLGVLGVFRRALINEQEFGWLHMFANQACHIPPLCPVFTNASGAFQERRI